MTSGNYNLSNIRTFLTEGFSDEELRSLCFDVPDFRPVYDQLAHGMGKTEIVARLLEHAERKLLIDTLLALAKERNPARYGKHQPYYVADPTPDLQRQVAALARRVSATETDPETILRIAQAKRQARLLEADAEQKASEMMQQRELAYLEALVSFLAKSELPDQMKKDILVHSLAPRPKEVNKNQKSPE